MDAKNYVLIFGWKSCIVRISGFKYPDLIGFEEGGNLQMIANYS